MNTKSNQPSGPQVLSAVNAPQQALISENALTTLINSHINDCSDHNYNVPNINDFNESSENQAFFIRNNEIQKDKNSVLSNQARLTNHIMSLDEVDISNETHEWNGKSPKNGQFGQGGRLLTNQMSQQDRVDNDSFQQIVGF